MIKISKKKKFNTGGSKLVYTLLVILPLIQCVLFTFYVYFNTVIMAFQEYDTMTNQAVGFTWNNFKQAFEFIKTNEFLNMVKMSLEGFFWHVAVGVPLGVVFAFYMSKKRFMSGLFRVLLFMPSIIPAIALVTIFNYFGQRALPELVNTIFALEGQDAMTNPFLTTASKKAMIIFYNVFIGFGASVLMYTNKMSSIDPSIVEAAQLDGAGTFREFWHIALPQTYSTIAVFLYTSIASIFLDQMNLFSFYGWKPDTSLRTIGYYFFYQSSDAVTYDLNYQLAYLSAFGLIMTAVAIPITFIVKKILTSVGPTED